MKVLAATLSRLSLFASAGIARLRRVRRKLTPRRLHSARIPTRSDPRRLQHQARTCQVFMLSTGGPFSPRSVVRSGGNGDVEPARERIGIRTRSCLPTC